MPSHHPPPIRTSTGDSRKSLASGAMSPGSDALSPTSTCSRSGRSVASPAEESFFSALAHKVRHGRSRSRTRSSPTRSKSHMVMPPNNFPPASCVSPTSPTCAPRRPHLQQSQHATTASQSSFSSTSSKQTRPGPPGPTRRSTSGSDMWRGRHSNSWLFNDFSVTDTAKDLFHIGRKS